MAGADAARSSHSTVQETEKNEVYSVKPGDLPGQSKEIIPKDDQIVVRMSNSLISDWRKTQRLTGLIPLYVRLKFLTSRKTLREMDPILHRLVLLQCNAYIVFQAIENICHLQGKGILPLSMIEKRGGMAKWIAWSCRAWCVGVVSDFFRLWREAEIEKKKCGRKTAQEQADFNRKWWNELMVAACWLPVAVHSSFYPKGIRGMNAGIVSLLGLIASLNSFRNQWRATG
ncbi:uncharacterized protein Z519_00918 [Cladophialophora bantiana CBS 173.52]|uniref:Uncharacterized protein n=1 Tax=Cladophialophora bantiana (strain ATCC 10958 / CBS 173.52 / CDC B-1940 / NIH 8579) TaxID=1442370 RepID=A0A0D2I7M9_CLAB1|nr:uncharacterized protein Z519_00918 [Cladophialophora bantiana CBS 173.52]KIW99255.1 hypothetical protein Z519_00918 [Cladophialophora bantiana CBS 173.52]